MVIAGISNAGTQLMDALMELVEEGAFTENGYGRNVCRDGDDEAG